MGRYRIRFPYFARRREVFYDTTGKKDEWQLEVYLRAAELARSRGLRSVTDLGCGSGYKLVEYLGEFETTGIEVPRMVDWLKERYPDRRWIVSDLRPGTCPPCDLLICADVLEHTLDPDGMLDFVAGSGASVMVFSTPDRSLLYGWRQRGFWGPPDNPGHVREWSFREFGRYVSDRFEIEEHVISNRPQATQMVVCRPRPAGGAERPGSAGLSDG